MIWIRGTCFPDKAICEPLEIRFFLMMFYSELSDSGEFDHGLSFGPFSCLGLAKKGGKRASKCASNDL